MPDYAVLTTPDELDDLLDRIGEGVAALDFEGWDIVRSVQLCNDHVWAVVDFGPASANWFSEVAHWFEDAAWVVFNSSHELRWFARHDAYPTCWDVGHLWRAREGGGHMSLQQLVKLVLDVDMSKEQQRSDWDSPQELSQEQLDYAADDARLTWDCWKALKARADAGHWDCFNMLDRLIYPVLEMEDSGLLLDVTMHRKLIQEWERLKAEREVRLRELVPEDEVANLSSSVQLSDYFSRMMPDDDALAVWPRTEKTGRLSTKNRDLLELAGMWGGTPLSEFLRLLAERSTLEKYLSSFGETLVTKARQSKDGRIRPRFNIAAAVTCRFSSSAPNVQQIPRDREFFGERMSVRSGFVAAPGNLIVSLDYSGIEMVVLALESGDETLLHDVLYGDPHAVMAEYVVGRPIDKKVPEDYDLRQSMKAVNFGIIYGTTANGLAGRQGWTYTYAQDLLSYWASRYPVAWQLRNDVMDEARASGGYIRMTDGGTINMGATPSKTRCANFPVQRGALSIMARAMNRHKDSLDDYRDRTGASVMMCATIHDALLDEAEAERAHEVLRIMRDDMVAGYLDVYPDAPVVNKLVEGGVGPSWGELKEVDLGPYIT